VKLAESVPLDATVNDLEKRTVPYGLVTCRRITVPVGGVGVIVAVIVPVPVFR
jgi:hypothetical protein